MFNYTTENESIDFSQKQLELLEAIDAFQYPVLNPTYKTLGDLHQALAEVRLVEDAGHTKPRPSCIIRITLGDVKRMLAEAKEENERSKQKRGEIDRQRMQCNPNTPEGRAKRDALEYLYPRWVFTDQYKKLISEHENEPDSTLIEWRIPENKNQRLGYYIRETIHTGTVKGVVVLQKDYFFMNIAITYIHEMMHAFYDVDLSKPMNDAEYAEEPLAEYGMLHFVQEFVKANPQYKPMMAYALQKVQEKQLALGIVHYGFGAYLFQKFQHVEWEKLMRAAHSKIDTSSAPYIELKEMLRGIYPNAKDLKKVADKLYEVLSLAATGKTVSTVPSKSSGTGSASKKTTTPIATPTTSPSPLPTPASTTPKSYTKQPLTSNLNNTLLDNSDSFCMAEYVKAVLNDPQCTEVKIATGYWDMPGMKLIYDELKSFLERGGKLQLLLGQEPMLRTYMLEKPQKRDVNFPGFYIRRDIQKLNEDFVDVAQLLIAYSESQKSQIEVRVYGKENEDKFLHAKCYIFLGTGFAKGVIGSSNFTYNGLLENAELNYLETNTLVVTAPDNHYANTKSHLTWFNEKWEDAVLWTGKFIEIINTTPGRAPKTLTPYEVYIRLLQDCFGVDDQMDTALQDYLKGTVYTPQPYQLDAVKQCYNIMQKMGGFLLADVVGLGKTVVGCMLIRYYLEHCKKNDGTHNHVLIIAPPAILQGWKDTIAEFDKANPALKMADYIDIISLGKVASLGDDVIDENSALDFDGKPTVNYGLIMIDESHRFRNSGTLMYDSLDDLINNIRNATGESPYVGLVSATPQNNRPQEIKNQIRFFVPFPKKSQFTRIPNCDIDAYFSKVKKKYDAIDPLKDTAKLVDLSNDIRDKILNDIIVRRTRSDIENLYPGTIKFPSTIGPNILEYKMSTKLATLFLNTVDIIDFDLAKTLSVTSGIRYHRYSAVTRFVSNANKTRYEGRGSLTVDRVAAQLARNMKLLLIKRLESSFDAFKESLENLSVSTQNMIDMWNDDCIFICPQLDVNAEIAKHTTKTDAYISLRKKITAMPKAKNAKGQNAEYHRSDFDTTYINDLMDDKKVIDTLLARWKANTEDPKLDEFKAQLPAMMSNDIARANAFIAQMKAYAAAHTDEETEIAKIIEQTENLIPELTQDKTKLVIFSEAIATTDKIVDTARTLGYRVLKITAANRDAEKQTIQENFDANYDKAKQKDDYDILVTTEVLAEGVNLHRANAILNYDSPWNAARLIQRIGRVNRIGSKSKAIFVYNFFPSANGNAEIQLIENAYRKLQAFHTQFGEDDKVFNPREILSPANFRSSISGPDSWQIKFMKELMDYKDNNAVRFAQIMKAEVPLRIAFSASDANGKDAQIPETLCAIQNSSASNKFFVAVDAAGTASGISMQDILEHCQCKPDTPDIALPANVEDVEQRAMDLFNQHYNDLAQQRKNHPNITTASNIVRKWYKIPSLSNDSRSTLTNMNISMRNGNIWMAKKVIDLESEINNAVDDTIIESNFGKVVVCQVTMPVPSIYITFSKQ